MTEPDFSQLRRHYPLLAETAYFDSASTGAVPDFVLALYEDYQQGRYLRGGNSSWDGMTTPQMLAWARARMAAMLGGPPEAIAFGINTSQMLSQFTAGIPLRAGDNVVLTDSTFLSMAYAWDLRRQNDGIELRFAPSQRGYISTDAILSLCDAHTRVIALSHVESNTGFRHDLAALGAFCRERDILLAVDAAQSAGVMPIAVETMGVDFLAGNNYKWMQGFCGVGYGYFGPRAMAQIRPTMAGWQSHAGGLNFSNLQLELRPDAVRFEYGYPDAPAIYALGRVAETYQTLGARAIEDYVLGLRRAVVARAAERPGMAVWSDYPRQHQSQIIVLTRDGRYRLTQDDLTRRGVAAELRDTTVYGGAAYALRLGLHYYNNLGDIDRLFAALDAGQILR
jgi:selenocysteine lyase/cysteine desulfurase